jgi:hypothetical protein
LNGTRMSAIIDLRSPIRQKSRLTDRRNSQGVP